MWIYFFKIEINTCSEHNDLINSICVNQYTVCKSYFLFDDLYEMQCCETIKEVTTRIPWVLFSAGQENQP